jgi:hypothetical protein
LVDEARGVPRPAKPARHTWNAGVRAFAVALLALRVLAAHPAAATVLVPMSDEALVASSDAIVVGRVGLITTVALDGGRVVTRITLSVERALKGAAAGGSLVVTELGGQVGARAVVVLGAPEYRTGERVLAFLRSRADGSLETNGLALGTYHIAPDASGAPLARRAVPQVDERPLATFLARIAALALPGGAASDGRAGIAVAAPVLATPTPAFTFNGTTPSRWFEADCGDPITFSLGNVDTGYGEAASRAAVAEATAAWTDAPGSLVLGVGADASPAESVLSGPTDGRNVVQFEDPFSEVPDLVDCTGVLARGGFVAAFVADDPAFAKTVANVTFGRIVEGDITLNQGLAACPTLDAVSLAEIVAHEMGHAIGFGHSSENEAEPDPVLADALMFFRIHADGRGASVRQDDVAAMLATYPESTVAPTPLAKLSCRFDLGIFAVSCFDMPLPGAPFVRFGKARAAVVRAVRAATAKRQKKLLGRALHFLDKTDHAITKGVSGECGTGMHALVADLRTRTTAALEGIQ